MARAGLALPCALALSAAPVSAQEEAPDDGPEHLHLPGYEPESRLPSGSSSLRFEVAPEIVSHNPLGEGSQTSDELNLALTFAHRQPLADELDLAFNLGASKTIDNGSTSELAAGIELRTRPVASGFSVFTRYNVAREYADFFDEGDATIHRVITGLRYGRQVGDAEIGLQVSPRWNESSISADDHGALNLWGEVVVPVAGDKIHLIVEGTAERRWYEHTNAVLQLKRRDWRFASYIGLDLAGLIETPQRMVHNLTVGVEWLEVSSNVPSAERSDLSLLPAVAIRVAL